jgi:Cysteine-rich CPCC
MTGSALVPCPCCAYRTIGALGNDEICPVCFWHDDGQSDETAHEVWGGPNKNISLAQARSNFRAFGAGHREWLPHVRPPRPEEA